MSAISQAIGAFTAGNKGVESKNASAVKANDQNVTDAKATLREAFESILSDQDGGTLDLSELSVASTLIGSGNIANISQSHLGKGLATELANELKNLLKEMIKTSISNNKAGPSATLEKLLGEADKRGNTHMKDIIQESVAEMQHSKL